MNVDELYTLDKHGNGAEMQVKDQNGKPLDMFITLAGVDSKLFRLASANLHRELVKPDMDANVVRMQALADTTISWRKFTDNGKELSFSNAKVFELYLNAPYLAEQVDEFIAVRENFI